MGKRCDIIALFLKDMIVYMHAYFTTQLTCSILRQFTFTFTVSFSLFHAFFDSFTFAVSFTILLISLFSCIYAYKVRQFTALRPSIFHVMPA